MKLKNIAIILTALILAILCICVCGCAGSSETTTPVSAADTSAAADVHNVPTEPYDVHNAPAQVPEKIDYTAGIDLTTPIVIEESKENPGEYIIIDNRDFTYTLKALIPDGYQGYEIVFEFENKSGRTLTIYTVYETINGWQLNAGERGDNTAAAHTTVEHSSLCGDISKKMMGSTSVDEIMFNVCMLDDYKTIDLGRYVIYPSGKSPEDIEYAEITVEDDDVVVVDNSEFTFVIKGIYNGEWMLAVVENKTDYTISCGTRYRKVNNLGGNGNVSERYIAPHTCYAMTLFFNRGNHNVLPADFSFDLIVDKIISTNGYRNETEKVVRKTGRYTLTLENVDKLKWME